MPRIRTIKPEFWVDERIGLLSFGGRLLFIGSWNLADDEGLLRWNPTYLKSSLFMYDKLSTARVKGYMDEVERLGLVLVYLVGSDNDGVAKIDPQVLAKVINFGRHQRISRPKPTVFPGPPETSPDDGESAHDPRTVRAASALEVEGSMEGSMEVEGNGVAAPDGGAPRWQSETVSIVKAWWDGRDPKPAQRYPAVCDAVERVIRAGWPPDDVGRALERVPTVSVGWLEGELRGKGQPKRQSALDATRAAAAAEGLL